MTEPKTPEQRWNDVAVKAEMSKRDLHQLAMQVFINEQNFQDRIRHMMETNYSQEQLKLWAIQNENAQMEQRLLTFRLRRKLQWLGAWQKFLKLFVWLKKKPDATPKPGPAKA